MSRGKGRRARERAKGRPLIERAPAGLVAPATRKPTPTVPTGLQPDPLDGMRGLFSISYEIECPDDDRD